MEKRFKKENFIKGAVSISFAVILTKIIGVLYKIPLSYILGDEGMGYFNSAYAIYGFFYILCTSGVPKAITLSVMKYNEKTDRDAYHVIRSGTRTFLFIGIIITAFTVLFSPTLVNIIGSKKSLYTILTISPSIIFVSLSGVFRGCLNAYNKLKEIALSQLIESLIKLALGLLLAFVGYRLDLPLYLISALCVLGITLGSMMSAIYLWVKSKMIFADVKIEQKCELDYRDVRRNIIKIALPISLGAAVLNLGGVLDLGIIMRKLAELGLSESESAALYGNYTTLVMPMFNLVISIISPIALAFLPRLAEANNQNDETEFFKIFKKMLLVNNLIAIPACFAFNFYSFELLDILFSVSSSALAAELLRMLSAGVILISLLTLVNTALEAKGKITITVISLLLGSLVKAIGNFVLVGKMGVLGASVSTVISYFVSLSVSMTALSLEKGKARVLRTCVPYILICYFIFALPYVFVYSRGKLGGGSLSIIVSLFFSCLLYLPFLLLPFLRSNSKEVLKVHKNVN